MNHEQKMEQERSEIVEAIDWIDAERKRLSRLCFSETRKKWHGERERGKAITLMKKQSEWLYRRRCRLRERIGAVNTALKEMRRARNGKADESFASVFLEVARARLPEDMFAAILDDTTERHGEDLSSAPEVESGRAVLEQIKQDMASFLESNERRPEEPQAPGIGRRETQTDFGIAEINNDRRIFPAYV